MPKNTVTAEHFNFAVEFIEKTCNFRMWLDLDGGDLVDLEGFLDDVGFIAFLKAQLEDGRFYDARLLLRRLFAEATGTWEKTIKIPDDLAIVTRELRAFYEAFPGAQDDFAIRQLALRLGRIDFMRNYSVIIAETVDETNVWLRERYRKLYPEYQDEESTGDSTSF